MRTEFLGKRCPVCRMEFKEDDNVVVCPECGTPHHRSCYARENRCGVESYHSQGFVWKGSLPDEISVIDPKPEKEEDLARNVGFYSEIPEDEFDPVREFLNRISDKTVGADGVSMKELTTFVSSSVFHYEQAFRRFRRGDGKIMSKTFFNICSGLLAPTHQFYRKMDAMGVLVIVAMLLPSLLLAFNESYYADSRILYLLNLLSIAEQILLCVFGDYLYYRHAVKKILSIRRSFGEDTGSPAYYEALKEAGRPSFLRAVVGTLVFMFAAGLILLIPVG